ncbi:uncharacterized protein isoform X2 [Choristoneura fumiferana]|uniref:uncharacterized protein isoform X2 n=1 Tax=Choristoneura fumiferana TaxID=7141 RepID=UPI003D154551
MKFAIAFAAFVAVAVASPYLKPIDTSLAELEAIVTAIQSPSTDPATAALLEQQLAELLEAHLPSPAPAPVVIDPAPITIGPAIIDFPLPDGGAVTAEPNPAVVEPSPAAVVPAPVVVGDVDGSPLVQIIVNINSANSGAVAGAPAAVSPAPAAPPTVVPSPVVVLPTPVHVAEPAPVVIAPEPIQIGNPIIPEPIVLLPDTLN